MYFCIETAQAEAGNSAELLSRSYCRHERYYSPQLLRTGNDLCCRYCCRRRHRGSGRPRRGCLRNKEAANCKVTTQNAALSVQFGADSCSGLLPLPAVVVVTFRGSYSNVGSRNSTPANQNARIKQAREGDSGGERNRWDRLSSRMYFTCF